RHAIVTLLLVFCSPHADNEVTRNGVKFFSISINVQRATVPLAMSVGFDVVPLVVRTNRSLTGYPAKRGSGRLQGETPTQLDAGAMLPLPPCRCQHIFLKKKY